MRRMIASVMPDLTLTHTMVARPPPTPYGGSPPPGWVYSGVNCAFPADDTGSSPHVRRPTSRCRRAAAGGRLVGAVPRWLHRVRLAARAGADRRSGAGAGAAHRQRRAAGDGPGGSAGLRPLP